MDTLLNIKAFLATARAGSFSAAARQLGVAPSVVVKRINRLEDQMRAQLSLAKLQEVAAPPTPAPVAPVPPAAAGAAPVLTPTPAPTAQLHFRW